MEHLTSTLETQIGYSVFGSIVNVWLVGKGVRPGMMFDRYDLNSWIIDKQIKYILDFAKSLNLDWLEIDKHCFIIGTKDTMSNFENNTKGIGEALGFQCYDHRYFNDYKRNRSCKTIRIQCGNKRAYVIEAADMSEITEQELIDHMNQKILDFKKVLPDNFIVTGQVKFVPSVLYRLEKIPNREYVMENISDYNSDLHNFCSLINLDSFENIVRNQEKYDRYLPLLKFIYEKYVCA